MKKRSLVAALAMLVVSAIVLTSSTYAWFATSSKASVDSISAQVTTNDGALTVQATGDFAKTGAIKKAKLTSSDYEDLTDSLVPVSVFLGEKEGKTAFNAGVVGFDVTNFSGYTTTAPNDQYLNYQFTVEYVASSSKNASIKIKPTFDSDVTFCYGLLAITVDGTQSFYYYAGNSGSYQAVTKMPADAIPDTNGNSIIDDGDTGYLNAGLTSPFTGATAGTSEFELMSVEAGKNGQAIVDVYVWAEGQDADCTGGVSAETPNFAFNLEAIETAVSAEG